MVSIVGMAVFDIVQPNGKTGWSNTRGAVPLMRDNQDTAKKCLGVPCICYLGMEPCTPGTITWTSLMCYRYRPTTYLIFDPFWSRPVRVPRRTRNPTRPLPIANRPTWSTSYQRSHRRDLKYTRDRAGYRTQRFCVLPRTPKKCGMK